MKTNELDDSSKFPNSRKNGEREKTRSPFRRPSKVKAEGVARLGYNPFKESWNFKARISFDRFIVHDVDGKRYSKSINAASTDEILSIQNGSFIPYFIEGRFARLYLEGTEGFRSMLFSLDSCAHTLLWWIVFNLNYGKDYVLLNRQLLIPKVFKSKDTFYKARNQLLALNIICKTDVSDHYWINAQYFFLGNRTSYLPEHVTVDNQKELPAIKARFQKSAEAAIRRRLKSLQEESDHLQQFLTSGAFGADEDII